MTRTEAFEKAWRLAMKGDFSLVDEIYHPDYKATDDTTGIELNLEDDKAVVSSFAEEVTIGPCKTLSEAENSQLVHVFSRFKNKEIFNSVVYFLKNPELMKKQINDCEKTLTKMTGYIERGSLEDKAKHKYSLEDYGLDEAEVHNKLNYS